MFMPPSRFSSCGELARKAGFRRGVRVRFKDKSASIYTVSGVVEQGIQIRELRNQTYHPDMFDLVSAE